MYGAVAGSASGGGPSQDSLHELDLGRILPVTRPEPAPEQYAVRSGDERFGHTSELVLLLELIRRIVEQGEAQFTLRCPVRYPEAGFPIDAYGEDSKPSPRKRRSSCRGDSCAASEPTPPPISPYAINKTGSSLFRVDNLCVRPAAGGGFGADLVVHVL